jgi:hypothetical protein
MVNRYRPLVWLRRYLLVLFIKRYTCYRCAGACTIDGTPRYLLSALVQWRNKHS